MIFITYFGEMGHEYMRVTEASKIKKGQVSEVRIVTRQVSNHASWMNEWFLLGLPNFVLCISDQVGRHFFHSGMSVVFLTTICPSLVTKFEIPKRLSLPCDGSLCADSTPRNSLLYSTRWGCLFHSLVIRFVLPLHSFKSLDDDVLVSAFVTLRALGFEFCFIFWLFAFTYRFLFLLNFWGKADSGESDIVGWGGLMMTDSMIDLFLLFVLIVVVACFCIAGSFDWTVRLRWLECAGWVMQATALLISC